MSTLNFIKPEWPAPKNIQAFTTTRLGGVSTGKYASLNLGDHVGDDAQAVLKNRKLVRDHAALTQDPLWLSQTHSNTVIHATDYTNATQADAIITHSPQQPLVIMTADCLPILICNQKGNEIAAIHAGWRGLADNIVANTLSNLKSQADQLLAWIGPAIAARNYEVGPEVREQFVASNPQAETGFVAHGEKWLLNLKHIAKQQLTSQGVKSVFVSPYCTYHHDNLFFSYRREGVTGRIASVINITC